MVAAHSRCQVRIASSSGAPGSTESVRWRSNPSRRRWLSRCSKVAICWRKPSSIRLSHWQQRLSRSRPARCDMPHNSSLEAARGVFKHRECGSVVGPLWKCSTLVTTAARKRRREAALNLDKPRRTSLRDAGTGPVVLDTSCRECHTTDRWSDHQKCVCRRPGLALPGEAQHQPRIY